MKRLVVVQDARLLRGPGDRMSLRSMLAAECCGDQVWLITNCPDEVRVANKIGWSPYLIHTGYGTSPEWRGEFSWAFHRILEHYERSGEPMPKFDVRFKETPTNTTP